jgi:hypothetical protein
MSCDADDAGPFVASFVLRADHRPPTVACQRAPPRRWGAAGPSRIWLTPCVLRLIVFACELV